jgi:GntR family transcriptional regulator, transcriptional repressor for pyruvate dehydrogenase complex
MTVTNEAVSRIKGMIATGELTPGSRLPSQDDLAYQLGLSRSALREAVRSLTTMNILVSRQGDGTYVSSLRTPLLLQPLAFAADILPDDAVVQLLDLRVALEPHAAALAAARVSDGDVHSLAVIAGRGAPGTSAADFLEADLAFHRRILDLSGNEAIATLCQAISPPALHARILGVAPSPDVRATVHDDHGRIIAALADHDVEAARAAMSVHVTGMRRQLRQLLAAAA